MLQHAGDDDYSCSDGLQNGVITNIVTKVVDLQDKRRLTALHWAAADGQVDALWLLLASGATVDLFDQEGMTPLALAVENEFEDAVELLLEYGADVNAAAGASGDDGYDTEMGSEDGEGRGVGGRLDERTGDNGVDMGQHKKSPTKRAPPTGGNRETSKEESKHTNDGGGGDGQMLRHPFYPAPPSVCQRQEDRR